MNAKRSEQNPAQAPAKQEPEKTKKVLLLRGYVPANAVESPVSVGQVPVRKKGNEFEYEEVIATLPKMRKGHIVELPVSEANRLIRADKACDPEAPTQSQLIRAGLAEPEADDAEE